MARPFYLAAASLGMSLASVLPAAAAPPIQIQSCDVVNSTTASVSFRSRWLLSIGSLPCEISINQFGTVTPSQSACFSGNDKLGVEGAVQVFRNCNVTGTFTLSSGASWGVKGSLLKLSRVFPFLVQGRAADFGGPVQEHRPFSMIQFEQTSRR